MLRPLLFIFLNSIAATLLGAFLTAHFFATLAPFEILLAIGGFSYGATYVLVLFLAAQFFPKAFFAAFPIKANKA